MRKLIDFADRLERWATYSAIAGIVVCVLWGVLTRYVTEKPASWTSELSGILFTWAIFIGAATAFREGRHIRIDVFIDLLPKNLKKLTEFVARLLVLAFIIYAAILSFQMMLKGATRPSPVLRIPFSYVYLAPLISFVLMAFTDVLRLFGWVRTPELSGEDVL